MENITTLAELEPLPNDPISWKLVVLLLGLLAFIFGLFVLGYKSSKFKNKKSLKPTTVMVLTIGGYLLIFVCLQILGQVQSDWVSKYWYIHLIIICTLIGSFATYIYTSRVPDMEDTVEIAKNFVIKTKSLREYVGPADVEFNPYSQRVVEYDGNGKIVSKKDVHYLKVTSTGDNTSIKEYIVSIDLDTMKIILQFNSDVIDETDFIRNIIKQQAKDVVTKSFKKMMDGEDGQE